MKKKLIFILCILILLPFIPSRKIQDTEFPLYKVVLDPGHGGVYLKNLEKHGDKYDMISGKYLNHFAEGANYKGIYEHKIVFEIASKALNILSYCRKDGDFEQFKNILKKYTNSRIKKIYIETILSRRESITKDEIKNIDDPNSDYRLYDFPSSKGKIIKGRISTINDYKPHLVVSLHFAESAPSSYKGMNGIIVPPYNILKKGLLILQSGETEKEIEDNDILESWFKMSEKISSRYAYYKDSAQYFTSFGIKKNYLTDYSDFQGYKYNMVTWKYSDKPHWKIEAEKHKPHTKYSSDYNSFKEEGLFWEREKSVYEEYRRGTGFRNFGGDNYFSTYEIIRFILYSLNNAGVVNKDKIPGKPFISTWSVPLLINAVSAYIELGYLNRKWDRNILTKRQNEISEGVAVGIYSLLAGIESIEGKFEHKPSGKAIDLDKYKITDDKSYFGIVTE